MLFALLDLDSRDSSCGESSSSASWKAKGAMELGSCPGGRSSHEFLAWRTGRGRGENVMSTNARPAMLELRSHAGGLDLSERSRRWWSLALMLVRVTKRSWRWWSIAPRLVMVPKRSWR